MLISLCVKFLCVSTVVLVFDIVSIIHLKMANHVCITTTTISNSINARNTTTNTSRHIYTHHIIQCRCVFGNHTMSFMMGQALIHSMLQFNQEVLGVLRLITWLGKLIMKMNSWKWTFKMKGCQKCQICSDMYVSLMTFFYSTSQSTHHTFLQECSHHCAMCQVIWQVIAY